MNLGLITHTILLIVSFPIMVIKIMEVRKAD